MMSCYTLDNQSVKAHESSWVAPTAVVIGNVHVHEFASIWWGAVLRGDDEQITIGSQSNVQDNCVIHADVGYPVVVNRNVTVGHQATLHGCWIGNNTLIGINAVLLNGVEVGENCIIGSNTLLTEGTVIPDGSLVLGSPGQIRRVLTEKEVQENTAAARRYVGRIEHYRTSLVKQ